ncbi:MAG: SPFH domain-containing protein [Defluviitaleaceae bacterium]|nr:SPFH domain-containing protein [Defluviitaleaceae bacterium]
MQNQVKQQMVVEERELRPLNGLPFLVLNTIAMLLAIAAIVLFFVSAGLTISVMMLVIAIIYLFIIGPIIYYGIKILQPNEAMVFTFFGKYHGTLKGPGIFFMAFWHSGYAPVVKEPTSAEVAQPKADDSWEAYFPGKKISLKTKTINNNKQKVNDLIGNPIIIDTMVVWRIIDTTKAMFNVENYLEYLSVQCDVALRNIVSLYPYDAPSDTDSMSLRGNSHEIAEALKAEIQIAANIAGLEIVDARITNLSYAPEIASAMLQRQQASAVVDAKHTIVEGAVDIVEMALRRLNANDIVRLDEERKAAMVSNLLVVLCGNKDAQPIVNSGSLY